MSALHKTTPFLSFVVFISCFNFPLSRHNYRFNQVQQTYWTEFCCSKNSYYTLSTEPSTKLKWATWWTSWSAVRRKAIFGIWKNSIDGFVDKKLQKFNCSCESPTLDGSELWMEMWVLLNMFKHILIIFMWLHLGKTKKPCCTWRVSGSVARSNRNNWRYAWQ